MKKINIFILSFLSFALVSSFTMTATLKGRWQFVGGIYNGKKEGAPVGYTLQRKYDDSHFEAFVIDSNNNPEKYEAGNYSLKGDTCIETETFSSQPSKLTDVPVSYLYSIRNDTLTLMATLPGGMVIEEYWKKSK
ncbi:hypothetical protein ACPPVU_16175 [Mucilaginibacter sp. McL0603]|uniref:hypothetical protein n=1 Tax=Mucilaginibacter sp. McL0603 TaxID=3415670 RepID=UPI003CE8CAA4